MNNGWTGAVLAGGRSSRMGRNKALIEIDGKAMLRRSIDLLAPQVDELLVIGDPLHLGQFNVTMVPDDEPGWGPLGGLITALRRAGNEWLVVVACDMPALTPAFIEHLKAGVLRSVDAIVPEHDGLIEPLAACYHRTCLEPFQRCVVDGRLKMSDALTTVHTVHIPMQPGSGQWPADLFRNINTPGDL